jgi:hypothetical protein
MDPLYEHGNRSYQGWVIRRYTHAPDSEMNLSSQVVRQWQHVRTADERLVDHMHIINTIQGWHSVA